MRCPICNGPVEKVRRSSVSPLNSDQFDAVRCGDYYCDKDRKYFWVRLEPNDNQSARSIRPISTHEKIGDTK